MNWTTRFFVATLLVLATTVGYGAARAINLGHQALANNMAQKAQFSGVNAFDMQIGSAAYQSSGGKTANKMSMAVATPAVTGTPPAYHDDDQDEQDDQNEDQNENEQGDSSDVRGTVSAVSGNMVTINGKTYAITNYSEVKGYVQVGSNVKLEYHMNPDGTLTIEELKVTNSTNMRPGSSNNQGFSSNPSSNYYYYHGHDDDDEDGD